ncbi:MAG: triose-phosphate isomerase [Nitrospirae bacterium]|nr:triose-phosphate isomerase [Nitrospirota bacterium]
MRRPVIAANWKMNKMIEETESFLKEFLPLVKDVYDVDILISPPFTSLHAASSLLRGSNVQLCGQNVYYEDKGAYTGEVSPLMLLDVGCNYVIIGHSERRQYFNESDEVINKKIKASIRHGLNVVFCVGESLQERDDGRTFDVLKRQIDGGLRDVPLEDVVVAYEPVWAIGTGKTATTVQAQEAHAYIRERLAAAYRGIADETRILYGGSVTHENIDALMNCKDVDGGLVGGASLKVESFARIVKFKK